MILTFITISAVLLLMLIIAVVVIVRGIKREEKQLLYNEELEETLMRYDTYVVYIRRKVLDSYEKIKQLDTIGAFESDDDTGVIFKNMKAIIESLNGDFEWLNQQPETNGNEQSPERA